MKTEFFVPLKKIPTVTAQEKKLTVANGKPVIYTPEKVKAVKSLFISQLGQHVPERKYTSGTRLVVKWLFPLTGNHFNGEFKTTKPDTDNLIKLLKDVMTYLGFWTDDALVCSEINEKFYGKVSGIYIRIEDIANDAGKLL